LEDAQRRKALGPEDFPNGSRAEGTAALLERLADFIDRVVLFAQLDDEVAGGRFLGLGLGSVARSHKKDRLGLTTEVVAQDVKGIEGIAEGAGNVFGRLALDQIRA